MADYQVELEFVGCFWRETMHSHARIYRCMDFLPAEAVTHRLLRSAYLVIGAKVVGERAVSPKNPTAVRGVERTMHEACETDQDRAAVSVVVRDLVALATSDEPSGDLGAYAKTLQTEYSAQVAWTALDRVSHRVYEMARGWDDPDHPRPNPAAVLREITSGVLSVHSELLRIRGTGRIQAGREELVESIIADTESSGGRGYRWPWPKLERMLGTNIQPGGVYGFTARPGGGKSLLATNLWRTMIPYAPVLPAVTEMPRQWFTRGISAEALVEQQVAELGRWDADDLPTIHALCELWNCSVDQARMQLRARRDAFQNAARHLKGFASWDYVSGRLTLDQLFASWKMLRAAYRGRHVVGLLDHAHNMAERDIDLRMPEIMGRVKEFCEDDEDGFSAIVFFQPRKLAREDGRDRRAKCRPVPASEISGSAEAILDTHASIFRQWVEVDHEVPALEWGQQPCKLDMNGRPVIVPEKEFEKWQWPYAREDNQHVYMEADKTRILPHHDGPQMKRIILNCWGPYGHMFEQENRLRLGSAVA